MTKMIDGMYVRSEGKCMDCGAGIAVLDDGTAKGQRTTCNCPPAPRNERTDPAYAEWVEGMKKGTKQP